MMKKTLVIIVAFLISPPLVYSQDEANEIIVDSLYREDQFYAGVTYNLLGKMPSGVSQNGFSSGFHLGFIRDMPINKKRNVALGLGIGYSANSFNQNLLISSGEDGDYKYSILDDTNDFTKNKFSQHLVEIPIEFRWRASTSTEYKFWRIYAGLKVGYVFANTSKYNGSPTNQKYSNIDDFNDFQYALTFSFGYNTWNFYLNYGLNPIFNSDATVDSVAIDTNVIKIGLVFYLL